MSIQKKEKDEKQIAESNKEKGNKAVIKQLNCIGIMVVGIHLSFHS